MFKSNSYVLDNTTEMDYMNMFNAHMDAGERSTHRDKDRGGCVGVDLQWVGSVWSGGEYGGDGDDVQEVARVGSNW